MNFIHRIEQSRSFWQLLILTVIFFLLRLPSLIEPYWYGDEGIYQAIGIAMNEGRLLYEEIWDNKPPLLYSVYALLQGEQFLIRFLSLIVGIGTVIAFYLLSRDLLKKGSARFLATTVFTVLFGLPTIEGNIANAENFMLIFIISAGVVLLKQYNKPRPATTLSLHLSAGLLLGIAFLFKTVAIFDLSAFLLFSIIPALPNHLSFNSLLSTLKKVLKPLTAILSGFLLPFVLSIIYFAAEGALDPYLTAIFFSNIGYVGQHNEFLLPQGLLLLKVLILISFVIFIILKRNSLNKPLLFVSLWTAFSLFNSFFSHRPYTHYLLVLLPSFSLIVGMILDYSGRKRLLLALAAISIFILSYLSFRHWDPIRTFRYYINYISFLTNQKSLSEYQAFFDPVTVRDYAVASYLNRTTDSDDTVFIWGNSAQIYKQLDKLPPGRFTVAYHILNKPEYREETAQALRKNPPEIIVLLGDIPGYPFPMYNYTHTITVGETHIYERID